MKRISCFLICLSIICIYSVSNAAPELPYLRNLSLKAKVTRDAQGIFTYGYEIINGKDSIGDLTDFDIDISKPVNGMQLSNEGLVNATKHVIGSGVLKMPTTVPMVPVGFPYVPDGWLAGPSIMGTGGWGAFRLKPGLSASGFVLQSRGIPTIRDFRANPVFDTELMKYYPDVESLPNEEVVKVDEQLKKDREAIAYKGKTIGPTAPPANFIPLSFIDYIIDLKHQAASLGWIKNEGVVKSLDGKLDNAKKKLTEGSTGAAKNILNAFINEVEAQGCATYENCPPGKHLTSEAHALLKYNALYLIDSLIK